MKATIKLHDDRKAAASSSGSSVAGAAAKTREAEMGKAPPCALYKDLITLADISACTERFWAVASKEEADALKKEIAIKRRPIADLMSPVKAAMSELARVAHMRKAQASTLETAKTGKGKGGGKGKGKLRKEAVVPGMPLMTSVVEHGHAVAAASEGHGATVEPKAFNPSSPLVINCTTSTVESFKSSAVTAALSQFLTLFSSCAKKSQRSAAAMTFDSDVSNICMPLFKNLLPESSIVPLDDIVKEDQVKPLFQCTLYAIAEGYCASAGLKNEIATIWYCSSGHREVVAVRVSEAVTFYQAKHSNTIEEETKLKAAARQYIFNLPAEEDCSEFIQQARVFHTTLSVGQALYMPAGFMILERVQASSTHGVSVRLLVHSDDAGLSTLKTDKTATGVLVCKLIEAAIKKLPKPEDASGRS